MKNSLRIHKWTHNEFNIFILGVLTHPHLSLCFWVQNWEKIVVNRLSNTVAIVLLPPFQTF